MVIFSLSSFIKGKWLTQVIFAESSLSFASDCVPRR